MSSDITATQFQKYAKSVNAAIQALNDKVESLLSGTYDPSSPEMQALVAKLQQALGKIEGVTSSEARLKAAAYDLEIAKMNAEAVKDAAALAQQAAEDAGDLAETARSMATDAMNETLELGTEYRNKVKSLEEKDGVLEGNLSNVQQASNEIKTQVQGFQGDLAKLAGTDDISSLSGSVSTLLQDATQFETRVSSIIGSEVTAASMIQQLADNIKLVVLNKDGGQVGSEIKLTSDGYIYLGGTVLTNAISVTELFARDITTTHMFQVNSPSMRFMVVDGYVTIDTGSTNAQVKIGGDQVEISALYGLRVSDLFIGNGPNKRVANFVCDYGTKSGWYYRKYMDGTCDMWSRKEISGLDITQAYGNWYSSYNFYAPDFPFAVSNSVCHAEWQPTNDIEAVALPVGSPSSTKSALYALVRPTSATGASGVFTMHIHGTW